MSGRADGRTDANCKDPNDGHFCHFCHFCRLPIVLFEQRLRFSSHGCGSQESVTTQPAPGNTLDASESLTMTGVEMEMEIVKLGCMA